MARGEPIWNSFRLGATCYRSRSSYVQINTFQINWLLNKQLAIAGISTYCLKTICRETRCQCSHGLPFLGGKAQPCFVLLLIKQGDPSFLCYSILEKGNAIYSPSFMVAFYQVINNAGVIYLDQMSMQVHATTSTKNCFARHWKQLQYT